MFDNDIVMINSMFHELKEVLSKYIYQLKQCQRKAKFSILKMILLLREKKKQLQRENQLKISRMRIKQ